MAERSAGVDQRHAYWASRLADVAATGFPIAAVGPRGTSARDRVRVSVDDLTFAGASTAMVVLLSRLNGHADALVAMLEAEGLPCAKVATIDEAVRSEQLRHRGGIVEIPFAGQTVAMQGVTMHLSQTPLSVRRAIPQVGEHNAEVLQGWLGYGEERIAALRREQVI